jgi:hypothetical protein
MQLVNLELGSSTYEMKQNETYFLGVAVLTALSVYAL